MADQDAVAKDKQFTLISILPDVCLTPSKNGIPVPYPLIHTMDQSMHCSPNVFFRGKPAYLHNESFVDNVRGDEAGAGGGVVTGTHMQISHNIDHSKSVYINGQPMVRTGDAVWMNAPPPTVTNKQESDAWQAKKKEWDCRQEQMTLAKGKLDEMPDGPEKDKLAQQVSDYENNVIAHEKALIAQDVYKEPPGNQPGFSDASNNEKTLGKLGVEEQDLKLEGSDFRARVYEVDKDLYGAAMPDHVVAFKGTVSGEDWKNNFQQGVNLHSDYYEQAVRIGTKLEDSQANVEIVGHSLGGGLASAASQASGKPATTYNAAGLHKKTVSRYGGTVNDSDIKAYRVKDEVLTGLQEPGWKSLAASFGLGSLFGGPIGGLTSTATVAGLGWLMPNAAGEHIQTPKISMNPIQGHFMDDTLASFRQLIDTDEQALAKATGHTCNWAN